MIITLEGLDNCGKNTIADLLMKAYPNTIQMDFPDYKTPFGRFISKALYSGNLPPLSLQLLFSSERLSKLDKLNALSNKKMVITTRYSYSALAYGAARGINRRLLKLLEKDLPVPQVKIFMNIPASESVKRAKQPDTFEKDFKLLTQVEKEYASIIKSEKDWYIVDAMQDINAVFCDIKRIIDNEVSPSRLLSSNKKTTALISHRISDKKQNPR